MHIDKSTTVIGLGEILWDVLPGGKRLGGAPANFAYHVQMMGFQSYIVSSIGKDELGREIIARLQNLNVPIDYISTNADYPTSTVDVELEAGHPTYTIHENVAWDHLQFDESLAKLAANSDAVCFGTLCQRNSESRQVIHAFLEHVPAKALRVYDINLRQNYYSEEIVQRSLEHANVLKLNEDELPILAKLLGLADDQEEQLRHLLNQFQLKMIALTRGPRGSLLLSADDRSDHPGIETPIKDTVGAGDSFTAAVVTGLLKGKSLEQINEAGNKLGTFVACESGATPDIPESFISSLY